MTKLTIALTLSLTSLNAPAAELPAPPLAAAWSTIDAWELGQQAVANERLVTNQNRFIPAHLRERNSLGRYAERELMLLPQRRVSHGLDSAPLRTGAFTVAALKDVAFAGRDEGSDAALGLVIEYADQVTFAGNLPDVVTDGDAQKQALRLTEVVRAVAPGRPTKITLVGRTPAGPQLTRVRGALDTLYAGVPVTVTPNWP